MEYCAAEKVINKKVRAKKLYQINKVKLQKRLREY